MSIEYPIYRGHQGGYLDNTEEGYNSNDKEGLEDCVSSLVGYPGVMSV